MLVSQACLNGGIFKQVKPHLQTEVYSPGAHSPPQEKLGLKLFGVEKLGLSDLVGGERRRGRDHLQNI